MVFTTCNMFTGSGFSLDLLGGFSMAWLGVVLLFFLIVFSRKWIGEMFGIPFSSLGAFILGYLAYLITISLACSYKIALGAGIIAFIIGAYFGPGIFGDGG